MTLRKLTRLPFALATMLLATAAPRLAAAETAAAPAVNHTAEEKALLKALDDSLARFDELLAQDKDPQHQALIGAFLNGFKEPYTGINEDPAILKLMTGVNWPNGFKQRAAAIHQAPFDQGKYDELKMDIDVQYQRLVVFLTPPKTLPRSAQRPGELALDQLRPSPANRTEVTAALAALDYQLKRLEEKNGALPPGPARESAATRLAGLKAQRAELARDFTLARWDAVASEMKTAR
jgi:hypothetical protein